MPISPVHFQEGMPLIAADLNSLQEQITTHAHGADGSAPLAPNSVTAVQIKQGEVKAGHLGEDAVHRVAILAKAVGGEELDDKAVQEKHLGDAAVVERSIGNAQVTREKLSAEVKSRLDEPAGPSAFGYCVFVPAKALFGSPGKPWYLHEAVDGEQLADISRLDDDGNLHIIRDVKAWESSKSRRIGPIRRVRRSDGITAYPVDGLAGWLTQPVQAVPAGQTRPAKQKLADSEAARERGLTMAREIALEGQTASTLPADVLERKRVSVAISADALGQWAAAGGIVVVNPGVGDNGPFTNTGKPYTFRKGADLSSSGTMTAVRILYNYAVPYELDQNGGLSKVDQRPITELLNNDRFIEFLNHPFAFPVGYCTSGSRNIRSVIRWQDKGVHFVQITFARHFSDLNYAVTITPDSSFTGPYRYPVILYRSASSLKLALAPVTEQSSQTAFSIAVFGRLEEPS